MKIAYLLPRIIRHFMPENLTRFLLRRGILIKPGLETREPQQAALRYKQDLMSLGQSLEGKHILVFGYGGRFALGLELLRLGAAKVTLTDLFAPPDDRRNDYLLQEFDDYLQKVDGRVQPKSGALTLLHGDIRKTAETFYNQSLDGIVSTSVYEHLDDVDGITRALTSTLKPGGFFIAYIDLRDHFFRFPFQMLCYSESVWRKWLNPTSNLNRFRVNDYRRLFDRYLPGYRMDILERAPEQFAQIKDRILPGFLSGDDQLDSITQIRVVGRKT